MKLKMLALWTICAVLALASQVSCYKYRGGSEPDFGRHTYMQVENLTWEKYVNREDVSQNLKLFNIFDQHQKFVKTHLNEFYEPDDFHVLRRFYEFNLLEKDMLEVHNLFEAYRQHLENELKIGDKVAGGFDERASLDFVETVLYDAQWPVNATLEQMQQIINGQGLYYKAIMVGYTGNSILKVGRRMSEC